MTPSGPTADRSVLFQLSQLRLTLTRKNITELSWTGAGQIGSILLGILSIKIITTVGPEDYGMFVLATSVTGMLSMAFFGPMEQGFVRHYFDFSRDSNKRSVFLAYLVKALLVSIVACFAISAAAAPFLRAEFSIDYFFLGSAACMVILTASSVPVTGMLNAFRLRKDVAATQLGEKLLTLAFLGGILLAEMVTISNIMACIALSAAGALVVRLRVYGKSGSSGGDPSEMTVGAEELRRDILHRIFSYSLPFVGWGFIGWMQLSGERWIMGGMLNTADVGRYGLGATLIQSSAVVAFNVLSQYVTPIIYEKYSDPNPGMRTRALGIIKTCGWITVVLFLVAAIFLYYGGELIINLVSKPEFAMEPVLLFALTIGLGFFYLGQMMISAGLAAQRPRMYIAPKILSAVFSLGAYTAGCMLDGVRGIVIAVVVANAVYAGLIAWTNRKYKLFSDER